MSRSEVLPKCVITLATAESINTGSPTASRSSLSVAGRSAQRASRARFRAAFGQVHASIRYWITSSARASSDGGIVSPSALAVVRLITNSNFEMVAPTGFEPVFQP